MRPQAGFGHVLLQPAIGLVDAAVEHQLGGPHFEPFGGELGQQGDGVVVELAPADGVEVAEEVDDLGVPAPPEVSGQRDALVVLGFSRKSKCRGGCGRRMGGVSTWLIRICYCGGKQLGPKHRIIAAGAGSGDPRCRRLSEAIGVVRSLRISGERNETGGLFTA